jgi:hypothetical protein
MRDRESFRYHMGGPDFNPGLKARAPATNPRLQLQRHLDIIMCRSFVKA